MKNTLFIYLFFCVCMSVCVCVYVCVCSIVIVETHMQQVDFVFVLIGKLM